MRHAIVGAGAVGMVVAAALAHAGRPVTLVMRTVSLARYAGEIRLDNPWRETRRHPVPAVATAPGDAEVVWLACKAHQLAGALPALATAPGAVVVPLLNGVGHLDELGRHHDGPVVAGSIRVEAHRAGPGHGVQSSLFAQVELGASAGLTAAAGAIAADLTAGGVQCALGGSPQEVLWRKLALLLPLALATTAAGGPVGKARRQPELAALMPPAAGEICAVGAAAGVPIDAAERLRALAAVPPRTRTSLQRDAERGAPTELDALLRPVLSFATTHAVAVPALTGLARHAVDNLRGE
nr:2-dehydropantoate 2-reductase [uncultured Actinoplanes sp.]